MAEIFLEIVKDALTEERAKEYRDQYDEGLDKEGYLITGDLKIEEIYVNEIVDTIDPNVEIVAYNDEIYINLKISLHEFLAEFLRRNEFRNILRILRRRKELIDKTISEIKKLDSEVKASIAKRLISETLKGADADGA